MAKQSADNNELAKSHATLACVPTCRRVSVPTCQCGLRANIPKACQLLILTCQHANKRANVPKPWQCFNLAYQRVQRCANFLNQKKFFLRKMIKEISILFKLLCKKFYIILDVIVIHIICRCIVHRNCIILHFYTSCNIKGKCGKSFFCFVFVFF